MLSQQTCTENACARIEWLIKCFGDAQEEVWNLCFASKAVDDVIGAWVVLGREGQSYLPALLFGNVNDDYGAMS
jgi:hypothetical protein